MDNHFNPPAPPIQVPIAPLPVEAIGLPQNSTPPFIPNYTNPYSTPKQPKSAKRRTRPAEVVLIAMALVMVVFLGILGFSLLSISNTLSGLFTPASRDTNPPANTFSVLTVVGTIQSGSGNALGMNEPSYQHTATVSYIKQLTQDKGNKGILLYMNTGGGGMYESDEVYRALMTYREETKRPVWVYMSSICASGGYYISMAAEKLTANYNATTGSIGVYIALTDTSVMYDNMGVKTYLIRSGDNKGIGAPGVEITPEQQAVYQSMVDETYERFVALVVAGRGLPEATVRKLADGRPYTAAQALQQNLVDELGDWESTLKAFMELTGAGGFAPNFSQKTPIGNLLSGIEDALPQADAQAILEQANSLPTGVPLLYAPGLGW